MKMMMTIVKCKTHDCVYMDAGRCIARSIEIDPNIGCLVYKQISGGNIEQDNSDNLKDGYWENQQHWSVNEDLHAEDFPE